ncbi:MAG: hypothetical protein WD751_06600 [Anaerolineales bacterium]
MLKGFNLDADDIALAIVLWVCSLPLIALIAAPAFGWKIAGLTAIILLALFLVLCWGTFRQPLFRGRVPKSENSFKSGQF